MDKKYLVQRRQAWYVQVRVPDSLYPVIGKRKITRSLHTRDLTEARSKRWDAVAKIKKYLEATKAHTDAVHDPNSPQGILESTRQFMRELEQGVYGHTLADREKAIEGASVVLSMQADRYYQPSGRDSIGVEIDQDGYRVNTDPSLSSAFQTSRKILQGELGISVLEALADHSKEIAKHTRIQTKNAREKRVRDFIEWLGVDREIKSITRQQAGSYITRVLLNKGHSIKTTKDTISDLSTFFNWCMQRGMIDSNPFYGLSTTVRETSRGTKEKQGTRRRPFTNDELVTLLTAIRDARGKDDPLWPLAILGLFTGMRGNEIAETEVTDVHDTYIHIPEGKTESSIRDVPIHPVISKLVADLKENSTDGYLISGLKRGGEDNKRYHVIGKRFSTVLRKVAKITDRQVVFHCLRKNLATALENAGVPESTAQQIAGHKKQSMTYGLYSGGVELEKLSKAMAKVDYGEAIEKLI